MRKFPLPNVPFVEARNVGVKHKPTAIVLDLSWTTSDKGAALGCAMRLHAHDAPPKSHHYVVDEAETYRGVRDNLAAYHAPYRAISVLICGQPHEDAALWEHATASPVLYRAASLVADLCLAHKIRPQYLDEYGQERWNKRRWRRRGGIIVRVPGAWPYEAFIKDVQSQILQKELPWHSQ